MNATPLPLLSLQAISAQIEDKKILSQLSLNLYPGKVHALMGPNGSGKSTLSKIIAGHPSYQVTEGSITYRQPGHKEQDLLQLGIDERSLAGIFLGLQYPIEIPGITNFDFLFDIFKIHCLHQGGQIMEKEEFLQLLRGHLELLQMNESFLHRSLNEGFSGGEKKKNEILQMLVLRPRLMILDETDSGLDIDALKVVAQGINHLRSPRTSILLVTHYQRLLDYVAPDEVHVMMNGKIVKSGPAALAKELEAKGYDWLKENGTLQ